MKCVPSLIYLHTIEKLKSNLSTMMQIVITISTISPLREMRLEEAQAISLLPPHELHFELHTEQWAHLNLHSS